MNAAAGPTKVAVFGLEVAEPSLVQAGMSEGWLPTMSRMLESGQSVLLTERLSGLLFAPWQTVVTGFPPQDHLCVSHIQVRPGSHDFHTDPNSMRVPPFWKYVGDAGRASTILGVYATPLVPGLRGTQICGWGAVDGYSMIAPRSEPPSAIDDLRRHVPGRRTGMMHAVPYERGEALEYLSKALHGIDQQADGIRFLMRETEWDLLVGGFPESHDAAHVLWRFHDPAHAEHDPDAPEELKAGVRTILRHVDTKLAELLEGVPTDTVVFLLAPQGMRAIARGVQATEVILEAGGWLKRHSSLSLGSGATKRMLATARAAGKRFLPLSARRAIGRASGTARTRLLNTIALADVDWSSTRAFAIPQSDAAQIRVNLGGREPGGIVTPGASYEQVLAEISETALGIVDDETGDALVESVVRIDEVIGGPVRDVLPDLVINWKPGSPRRLRSPVFGVVDVPGTDRRTGQHTDVGFVIGAGPGIEPSGRSDLSADTRSLVDFAPTVLARLGVRPPDNLPGRAIDAFGT